MRVIDEKTGRKWQIESIEVTIEGIKLTMREVLNGEVERLSAKRSHTYNSLEDFKERLSKLKEQ